MSNCCRVCQRFASEAIDGNKKRIQLLTARKAKIPTLLGIDGFAKSCQSNN
jgi:hypothetical protein